jgi:hypothetical protein
LRLAAFLSVCLRAAVFADHAIAFDRTAAGYHHVAILLLAHAGHAAGHLLEAPAVGGADLGQEIDVAAETYAPVEVARLHRVLLFLAHRPLVEVGALIGLEAGAVLGLHQRHAELVEVVAQARLLGIENRGAGNVLVGFVECHGISSSKAASDCPPGAFSAAPAWSRCAE